MTLNPQAAHYTLMGIETLSFSDGDIDAATITESAPPPPDAVASGRSTRSSTPGSGWPTEVSLRGASGRVAAVLGEVSVSP